MCWVAEVMKEEGAAGMTRAGRVMRCLRGKSVRRGISLE